MLISPINSKSKLTNQKIRLLIFVSGNRKWRKPLSKHISKRRFFQLQVFITLQRSISKVHPPSPPPEFILPRWTNQSQQPKAIFRKSMLNCMLICIQCEAFNAVWFRTLQKQCNNNKHQQQHFHPDWLAVIVELSSRLLWLQTELAEPISRKLQSKRTISYLLCYLKGKSCPTTGGSKWRWNRPKRGLFTSRCLCFRGRKCQPETES